MRADDILTPVPLADACLTLDELAALCRVSSEWIVRHIEDGSFPESGPMLPERRFGSRDVWRARHLVALEREFDAVPELAALVVDLLEEVETLHARLRRAALD
jgi:chaperone modulatory protein CbpM